MKNAFEGSRALWNRTNADLDSDETLAQLLDRGDMKDWRELYQLARHDSRMRERMRRIILTAPIELPHFWLAALASLGEPVDWEAPTPNYFERTGV